MLLEKGIKIRFVLKAGKMRNLTHAPPVMGEQEKFCFVEPANVVKLPEAGRRIFPEIPVQLGTADRKMLRYGIHIDIVLKIFGDVAQDILHTGTFLSGQI